MEITPNLNANHRTPLYIQLYLYIKEEIITGHILPGSKLPSIRNLSFHLNISKTTVENAYQQLLAEGYIESIPKSGMRVIQLENHPAPNTKLMSHTEPKKEENKVIYDFQYGDIELDKFPLRTWKKYINEALEYSHEVLNYGDKQGDYGLRAEICKYLYEARGVTCTPDQILITSGTQHSVGFICQLLALKDIRVAIEEPGYDGVRSIFTLHHCSIHPIPLEPSGINLTKLNQTKANVVYVTPSHQFPQGMIMSIQKRLKLLEWASQNDSFILEDDYDGEFRYQGQPIPSLKSLDQDEKVIYLGTFSKSFLPSARLSYIVFPKSFIHSQKEMFHIYSQAVSPIIQKAIYLFIKNGDFERHVRKMRKAYLDKHKALIGSIDQYMGDRVKVIGQNAGLHILLEVQNRHHSELIEKGLEHGVKVYTTESFWSKKNPQSENTVMLGFGGLSIAEIETGISLLKDAWFGV